MWTGSGGDASQVAASIRDAWRDIGVSVPYATASWGYISGLMRKGEYDVGLARLALDSDGDLFEYFHSAGALNLAGVDDARLDAALEAFRRARDRAARVRAEEAIAARLAALGPVGVLYAPTEVMLVSRRVANLAWIDDRPRLDRLELGPESGWLAEDARPIR